ncbi:MAG: bifunctional diaminohydroxyphosphoribosylaminopyrimidine deaminase/5-amino-6-(5-phosphoribosylamino)uracil reductase RibD [Candidatus Pelagibacter sp. TMED165]|nr:MAG: bifunctional diaminohydroxyphosphoribosylaminopyrimidine deaminase/5-amino-6-(5-phosphoribosylamino)uracil reductase RibD [Candidatus Pelagibacter sp. TMED165]
MVRQKNNFKFRNSDYLDLAFEQAKLNLGSTGENPSVGCVIEKNGSIISTGYTSYLGRPHAEFNALNKKISFKGSNLYVTLEPCSHHGKTPPCVNEIIKKKVKKIFFSLNDIDIRSKNKAKKILNNSKILVKRNLLKKKGLNFYKSYLLSKDNKYPLIDCKIAISKDYFTKNKKKKWLTNQYSRKRAHLLRSMYDCLITTSKSINEDNSLLNCRIEGLEKKSPNILIIDRNLTLKKNSNLFKIRNRKIIIVTTSNYQNKINYFKKKKVKIIKLISLNTKYDFLKLFSKVRKLKYSRILVESGLQFTNFLLQNKLIHNIFIFKTKVKLKKNGINFSTNRHIKKIKLNNKIKVNLQNEDLYKIRLK